MKVPNLRTFKPEDANSSKAAPNPGLENGASDSLHGDNEVVEYRTKGGVPKQNAGGQNTSS